MAAGTDHGLPAIAGHVVATAEQLVDRPQLKRQVMKATLALARIQQEHIVMIIGIGAAHEIAAPGIGVGELESQDVST